jgi:glucokinase
MVQPVLHVVDGRTHLMLKIGVDIGATKTVIAVLDDKGVLTSFLKIPSAKLLAERGNAVDSLNSFLNLYIQKGGFEKKNIQGIGIGVPAVLDSHTQEIVSCPNLPGLDHLPLGKLLSPKIGLPVLVENDVNLIAVGEHIYGRGRGYKNLACIFVGSGLGCGLIINGELHIGADGAAAEFGHTIYDPDGRLCGCGAHGCVEMYCSGRGLTEDAQSIFENPDGVTLPDKNFGRWTAAEQIIKAAKKGHPQAIETMNHAFFVLGIGITNLVNILNPQLIILGGGIVKGWPKGINTVRATVQSRARKVVRDRLEIDFPQLEDKAGLYGAAHLVGLTATH